MGGLSGFPNPTTALAAAAACLQGRSADAAAALI